MAAAVLLTCPDTLKAPRCIPPPPRCISPPPMASTSGAVSSTAGGHVLPTCPESLRLPIGWHQVKYFLDPRTGERKFDRRTSPISPLPHPDLEFAGYVLSDDRGQISAFFKKKGLKGTRGCRLPRESGGVNKGFFDGTKDTYVPRRERYGPSDPEL
jgi:hypothetical protein